MKLIRTIWTIINSLSKVAYILIVTMILMLTLPAINIYLAEAGHAFMEHYVVLKYIQALGLLTSLIIAGIIVDMIAKVKKE
jgi:hypothetical protein